MPDDHHHHASLVELGSVAELVDSIKTALRAHQALFGTVTVRESSSDVLLEEEPYLRDDSVLVVGRCGPLRSPRPRRGPKGSRRGRRCGAIGAIRPRRWRLRSMQAITRGRSGPAGPSSPPRSSGPTA